MPNVNCWGEQRLCVKMVEVFQWGIISSRTCNLSINVMSLWWEVSSKGFSIKLVDMMLACTFVLIRSVPDGLYYCLRRYSWQWGLGIFFQSNKQQSPPERWIFLLFVYVDCWIKGSAQGYIAQVTVKAGFITDFFCFFVWRITACFAHTHQTGHMLLLYHVNLGPVGEP